MPLASPRIIVTLSSQAVPFFTHDRSRAAIDRLKLGEIELDNRPQGTGHGAVLLIVKQCLQPRQLACSSVSASTVSAQRRMWLRRCRVVQFIKGAWLPVTDGIGTFFGPGSMAHDGGRIYLGDAGSPARHRGCGRLG